MATPVVASACSATAKQVDIYNSPPPSYQDYLNGVSKTIRAHESIGSNSPSMVFKENYKVTSGDPVGVLTPVPMHCSVPENLPPTIVGGTGSGGGVGSL